jgi:hypothetical protein
MNLHRHDVMFDTVQRELQPTNPPRACKTKRSIDGSAILI